MICGGQLAGLRRPEGLDPERARQSHERQIEAVVPGLGRPRLHVVSRRVDRVIRLAGQLERPAPQTRWPPARSQGRDQLLRPQVLMDVDPGTHFNVS